MVQSSKTNSKIYATSPKNWQELETRVCQTLSECGCKTTRSKHLALPRGQVDIDVYALDGQREPNLLIICECKHWKKRVSQSVVHAFRTIVLESGAHVGFLISSAGFQAGAVKAASQTNVELVTWQQFQDRFYNRWFEAMRLQLAEIADQVFEYSDYFHRRTTSVLHGIPERVEELGNLHVRFSAYMYATSYNPLWHEQLPAFPIEIVDPRPTTPQIRKVRIKDARMYFDLMLASAKPAIAAYEEFITKHNKADSSLSIYK